MMKNLALDRKSILKVLGILGFYFAIAITLTWPLAAHINTHLPLGTESVATVPLFNLWTLQWNGAQLLSGYQNYWEAPIFFPYAGSFALSEAMPFTGLMFSVLYGLVNNAVAAYNLTLLLGLALNGYAAYLLSRQLSVTQPAAVLTGVLAVSLPFVWRELGVLQLTILWPLFLTFVMLLRFKEQRGLSSALGIGIMMAVTIFTSSQYGLFLSLFLILAGVVFFQRDYFSRKTILNLGAGIVFGALLIFPIVVQQRHILSDYTRSKSTITNLSAEPIDYLRLDRRSWGEAVMPWLQSEGGSGQRLYPGTGLLVLASLGAMAGWKHGNRKWVMFCLLGAGMAFGLSLGFNLSIRGWEPYELLYSYYPGFMQLRSPFRLGGMVQVFLVGLVGFGIAWLWSWKGKWGAAISMFIILFSVAEVSALPARLAEYPKERVGAEWVDWLADQPEGAVMHLPISKSTKVAAFEETVIQMLQGLQHGHPLANGYSGFSPRSYQQLKREALLFPNEYSLRILAEAGILYVVVARDEPGAYTQFLLPIYSDEDVFIFGVE